MNTTKAKTSKVLLIILGVLVALVIGFSSNVGAKGFINWNMDSDNNTNLKHQAKELFRISTAQINKKIVAFFTHY